MMFREKNDRAILKTISEILQHDNKEAAEQFKTNSAYLKNTTYAGLQLNESSEQLDEISMKTKMSYVSKAVDQIYGHGQKPLSDRRKLANRHAGAERVADAMKKEAAKKLTQEDLDLVVDILNQLDEEQLDEISKKTLGSYINKASDSIQRHERSAAAYEKSGDAYDDMASSAEGNGTHANKAKAAFAASRSELNKSNKRVNGIAKATAKLTKEDLDNVEEETKPRVGANHIHIKSAGNGKYKVHAVGKNFSDGIQVGEHLTDTDLDDFTEIGGKIKHISESRSLRDILEQARRYSGE